MSNHKIRVLLVIVHNRIKKNNKALIYCRITYNKSRKQFATGIFIEPNNWNNIKQNILPISEVNTLLNNKLSPIYQKIEKVFFTSILLFH